MCSGQVIFEDRDTGQQRNSRYFTGENVTFNNEEFITNRRYSVTVTANNVAGIARSQTTLGKSISRT